MHHDNLRHGPVFSRRKFLQTTGIALGACASVNTTRGIAADPKKQEYVDAHVHVWTPDTQRYPLATGFSKKEMQPASFTPEELFVHSRPAGVRRIVLIQMSYYGFDNSYMLDMMRKHRGVFSGVAVIDENNQPQKEMSRLAKQGVRGFRIRPGKQSPDRWLAGAEMQTMWKYGAKAGLAMCHLIGAEYLSSVDSMCRRFPETPVVIDHFARIGIDGKVRSSDIDNLCGLARHQNVSVKISAYYALGKKQAPYLDLIPMIRRLLDSFGRERLMWASDCPFQVVDGHTYQPSIDLIRKHTGFLSSEDRDWLLQKTAERVFFS